MKMIASAKLHSAQATIASFLPYSQKLDSILKGLLSSEGNSFESPYSVQREIKRVSIAVISSNSSLCGAYNANVIREFQSLYSQYSYLGKENILVYPIGKKIHKYASQHGLNIQGSFEEIANKPTYEQVSILSHNLVQQFLNCETDRIEIVYTHFRNIATQYTLHTTYLPFALQSTDVTNNADKNRKNDYILEPERSVLLLNLLPKVLETNLLSLLLDSNAAEHGARSMAMQIATDNATDLIQQLQIEYNKSRQSAITNQLLDIIGGASALT
jgi:F-type H+-transporting ATPase subunit gamma